MKLRQFKSIINTLLIFLAIHLCTPYVLATGISFVRNINDLPWPNSKVWDIEKSEQGNWMFFATDNGIIAYDGNLFDVYPLNNGSEARSLYYDKLDKRLYIGGINEFGYLTPSAVGKLGYFCLSDEISEIKNIGNIWGIHSSGQDILIQGDHDIIIYNPAGSNIIYGDIKINCSSMINDVLYLGTEDGVKQLRNGKIVPLEGADFLKGKRIRNIVSGPEGLLIATAKDGIFSYGYGTLKKLIFKQPIEEEIFTCAYSNNIIAIGTVSSGLYLANLSNNSLTHYNETNGLINNTILSTQFDNRENLWIGHDGGLEEVYVDFPLYTLSNATLPIGHGYVSKVFNDRLWLGTNRGLYSLPYPLKYPLDFTQISNLEGQTWNLKFIGNRFFLCHDHGLFEIFGNNTIKHVEMSKGVWDVQPVINNDSKLLIGAYDGLFSADVNNNEIANVIKIDGFYGSPYNFVQVNDSIVWVCEGTEGIAKLNIDFKNNRVVSYKKYVSTDKNQLLIGNNRINKYENRPIILSDLGIFRYDKKSDKFIEDVALNSYIEPGQKCLNIKKDGNFLYILTENSVIQVNEITNERKTVPLLKDWVLSRHYGDMLNVYEENKVLIPSSKGYIDLDFTDSGVPTNEFALNAHKINAIFSTNQGDSLIYRANYLGEHGDIKLDYTHNSIKLLFGNEKLARSGVASYRYKLNNDSWSDPTFVCSKEYSDLREGNYTFTLETTFIDGTVEEDTISFSILEPWYRTTIAYIIYALLLLAGIIGSVYIIKRAIRRKELFLKKEQETKILMQQIEFKEKERIQKAHIEQLEREKMQEDYNHKTQELSNLLINEANKNEILLFLKEGLNNLLKSPNVTIEHKKKIESLLEKIKGGLHAEKILERVENEFNLLHNSFTLQLRQNYPSLTNNEVMLCSYLKMNLSTKEIAPLMNISARGVETMRYRIRKKLDLGRGESLSSFIANFL